MDSINSQHDTLFSSSLSCQPAATMINLLLLLLLPLIGAFASDCNSACGPLAVPYPFGFSPGCPIPLACTPGGTIQIGRFAVRNVTSDRLLVAVPPSCNRSIVSVNDLFRPNFALTRRNGLLLRDCGTNPSTGCSFSTDLISNRLNDLACEPKEDKISCYSNSTTSVRAEDFLTPAEIRASGCGFLFSSVTYESNADNLTALVFSEAELGWWVEGPCQCAAEANCTSFNSPASGNPAFRCKCVDGYEGDGFSAAGGGRGCVKVSVTGAAVILLACLLSFLYFHHRSKVHRAQMFRDFLQNYGSIAPKRYKYSEVKRMTKCFHEKLGQGGFGSVFKGSLSDGCPVAVKVLTDAKGDGQEFVNEVDSIVRTSHVNVVRLLGFCLEGSRRALIYDFMCNGSLEKHIFSEDISRYLGWEKLYGIALGIARGLEYLHRGCNTRIVHFDIKPHNILLDQDFCPKISDFGLAKLCQAKDSALSMADARGTIGYIAPEVVSMNFGVVSSKSDVYGYGMMLLEMAGGRKNVNQKARNISQVYFPHWIHDRLSQDGDLRALGVAAETEEVARKLILVGLWCIQTMPQNRPSMSRVIEMLEGRAGCLELPPKHFSSPSGSSLSASSVP